MVLDRRHCCFLHIRIERGCLCIIHIMRLDLQVMWTTPCERRLITIRLFSEGTSRKRVLQQEKLLSVLNELPSASSLYISWKPALRVLQGLEKYGKSNLTSDALSLYAA